MKPLVIIKLGGSVITYKESKTPKARLSVIKTLAKEIAQIVRIGKYRIVLVHGGGSFASVLITDNLAFGVLLSL